MGIRRILKGDARFFLLGRFFLAIFLVIVKSILYKVMGAPCILIEDGRCDNSLCKENAPGSGFHLQLPEATIHYLFIVNKQTLLQR